MPGMNVAADLIWRQVNDSSQKADTCLESVAIAYHAGEHGLATGRRRDVRHGRAELDGGVCSRCGAAWQIESQQQTSSIERSAEMSVKWQVESNKWHGPPKQKKFIDVAIIAFIRTICVAFAKLSH
jgi:hypothetical protein